MMLTAETLVILGAKFLDHEGGKASSTRFLLNILERTTEVLK